MAFVSRGLHPAVDGQSLVGIRRTGKEQAYILWGAGLAKDLPEP